MDANDDNPEFEYIEEVFVNALAIEVYVELYTVVADVLPAQNVSESPATYPFML